MYVEAIMSLVRLSQLDERVTANLGEVVLSLVEQLRDLDLRAELAEAGLEAERVKLGAIRQALGRVSEGDAKMLSSVLQDIATIVAP